jgi:hypothetical protein
MEATAQQLLWKRGRSVGERQTKKMVFSYIITSTYEGNSCVQAQHQCYNARSTSPINNELAFTSEKLPNHQSFIFENKTQNKFKRYYKAIMWAWMPGSPDPSLSHFLII